jgi:hypothetical protein
MESSDIIWSGLKLADDDAKNWCHKLITPQAIENSEEAVRPNRSLIQISIDAALFLSIGLILASNVNESSIFFIRYRGVE